MEKALFMNGVFETVLIEIEKALEKDMDMICYLQPYSNYIIKELEKSTPSLNCPMWIYILTSSQLNFISYLAQIVGWKDKKYLSPEEENDINEHITKYQPKEEKIYRKINDKECCVNLIYIKNLRKFPNQLPVEKLIKISDGLPLKKRTRAGGWSYVYPLKSL
jgi:hypothetical protein